MHKTYNTSHVRQINQRAVLDTILRNGSISKAELARQLGLSKPAMSDNTQAFLEMGLIHEERVRTSGPDGGRPPIMLTLNGNYKYIIAIDYFYTFSVFMLGNIKGEIVEKFTMNQTPAQSFEAWMDMSVNAVNALLLSQGICADNLAAIGFSAPGVIDREQNHVIASAMGAEFDIRTYAQKLKDAFHCTTCVKNSANIYAITEAEYGAGKGYKNILYISCGEGIGAGILVNGQLYEGSSMAAGEIGNFVTRNTLDKPTRLEQRIGTEALIKQIRTEAPSKTLNNLNLKQNDMQLFLQVVNLWEKGDPYLRKLVEELSLEIGCIVADMAMLMNADIVILGGEYIVFSEQMIPIIQKIVQDRCYLPSPVVPALLGREGRGRGMIALCREQYFDQICGLGEK